MGAEPAVLPSRRTYARTTRTRLAYCRYFITLRRPSASRSYFALCGVLLAYMMHSRGVALSLVMKCALSSPLATERQITRFE